VHGPLACRQHKRTCNSIGNVIVRHWRMVDTVASAACSATFKAAELRDQFGIVQKLGLATVQQRQRIAVDVTLGLLTDFVFDAMLAESFPWPFSCVSVALNARDAIALE